MLSINWKPDKSSPEQLHIQIIRYIKDRIASGDWPAGTRLPSQRTLSELFCVNRSTIVAAMEELASEGIVAGKTGGGTRIINNTWTLISNKYVPNWNNYVSSGTHQPNQAVMQLINKAEYDPGIIRLGSCEPSPELIPSKTIQTVLKKAASNIPLGYEEPKGSLRLRKEICVYLEKIGIKTEPSCILITSGALQALQLICLGILHSSSVVYLEKPSYLYSLRTFQSFGMQLAGIPLDKEGIDLQQLSERNRQRKGSILFSMPTFHNPTGNVMSLKRRKMLLELCEKEQLPIIEDDVYRELWFDAPPPAPIKAFDKNGLVLYVGSLSKNLSPGLRIGWVTGPEQVINRLADIKMQTDYGSGSLCQYVAAELLSTGLIYEHNTIIRKNIKLRRDIALSALNKFFKGIATWEIPNGGYFIWIKLNKGISMYELFIKCLNRKILIYPGDLYEFHSNQYIRISYSYASLSEIEHGIAVLSELVSQQLK